MPPWLIGLFGPATDLIRAINEDHGLAGLGLVGTVVIVGLVCAVFKQRAKRSAAQLRAQTDRDLTKRCTPRSVDDVVKLMNANNGHDGREIPPRTDEAERQPDPANDENETSPSEDGDAM